MKKLNELELKQINGGIGIGWLAAGLFVGISFISGILSGYTNPTPCNISKNGR